MTSALAATQQGAHLLRRCQPFTSRAPCAQPGAPLLARRPQRVCRAAGEDAAAAAPEPASSAAAAAVVTAETVELGPRDDDVLPDSLTDALEDAGDATCLALERGVERVVVEILLPEFWDPQSGPVYAEEGDQQRFWKLTRRYLDNLVRLQPGKAIRAVYPDVGVSAMLKNQWTDAAFSFASLNDRKPVQPEDDIVVLAAPDPQGLEAVTKICAALQPGQVLVMFNPRLASGDVGIGLNMRRMREEFLGGFSTVYSLRPVGDIGSVFRRYPGMWQVFVQDEDLPGRYRLAAERSSRPSGEALDIIIMEAVGGGAAAEGKAQQGPGLVDQLGLAIKGMQRFMRSLSQ